MTFEDDATSYYGHKDPAKVIRVTNKNFAAIENFMNSNKLKVNLYKAHLLVISKSSGGKVRGREAAEDRQLSPSQRTPR